MDQVAELFQRPRTILKILYFSGDDQFFQNSPGIKFFMIELENFFIYWPGRHNLISTVDNNGVHLTGALWQGFSLFEIIKI